MQPGFTITGEIRAIAVRLFAYISGIAGLAIIAAELFQSAPVVAAIEPTSAPEWITVERPAPAFAVNLPEISEEPRYVIRRHVRGGGRKDIVSFGEPGTSLRFVQIEIYRPGSELGHFADAGSEIASRAALLGPAGDVRVSLPLDSKFGPVETVDFAVGRFGGGHCVGFVRSVSTPRIQITGMSCSMNTIVDRKSVTCVLDRLTLLSAGSDQKIAEIFARAEVNRKFCGQRDPLMYATPRYPAPAETSSNMRLRGSLASR